MKKRSVLAAILALLMLISVACTDATTAPASDTDRITEGTESGSAPSDSTAQDTEEATSATDTGADTAATTEGSGTTEAPSTTEAPATADTPATTEPGQVTTAPAATDAPTAPPETEPGDEGPQPTSDHVIFDNVNIKSCMSGNNQCKYEMNDLGDGTYSLKIITTTSGNDPFIFFNYKSYMSKYGLKQASANTYKYVVLKLRANGCSNSNFELFYAVGSSYGAAAGYSTSVVFDNADTDWQYVYFDLSEVANWKGNINGFRFDFMMTSAGAGEVMEIGEILFFKTYDEVKALVASSGGSPDYSLSDAEQKQAEELLKVADAAPAVSNNKINAANEDSRITLWFDHTYTKTARENTKSTGLNTYQMRLAKNEIEACQFLLSSTADMTGLTAELTEFTDGSGNTLKHSIHYGYYFDEKIDGQTIADPIPPLVSAFDLTASTSKAFLIKVYTDKDSKAGQYVATLTIKNADGQEIKKANVYVYVWDFVLPEAASCKTLADISWWNIYASHMCYEGDDSYLYKLYYDYLLENRICGYTLPYDTKGTFSDDRILEYLNNERVVAFNPVGWKTDLSQSNVESAYAFLSQNPEWLKKAYFYPVDEPDGKAALDRIRSAGELLSQYFPGYIMITPMHLNSALDSTSTVDYFEYIKDYVNAWCPHTFFYNSYADYRMNHSLTYRCSAALENNLGTFAERMAKQQAEGDEVWWYVTRFPQYPEITITTDTAAVDCRILFWQQKMFDVDGFLYYSINDWYTWAPEDHYGWVAKHEVSTDSTHGYDVYGNGVLVYCGKEVDIYGPVGSFRLECIRDGIEDYEYLTILDELYGEGTSDLIIKQITTSLYDFDSDEELFTKLRIAVGNLIDAKS